MTRRFHLFSSPNAPQHQNLARWETTLWKPLLIPRCWSLQEISTFFLETFSWSKLMATDLGLPLIFLTEDGEGSIHRAPKLGGNGKAHGLGFDLVISLLISIHNSFGCGSCIVRTSSWKLPTVVRPLRLKAETLTRRTSNVCWCWDWRAPIRIQRPVQAWGRLRRY